MFNLRHQLIALFLALNASYAAAFTVEITESELQHKLEKLMPFEARKLSFILTFTSPSIKLTAGEDVIRVTSKFDLIGGQGLHKSGIVTIKGLMHYEPSSASVFLRNPVIESIDVVDTEESVLPKVRLATQLVATGFFALKPVYVINGETIKGGIAKAFLKSMRVEDEKLILDF